MPEPPAEPPAEPSAELSTEPSPSPSLQHGYAADPFAFLALPYDMQESVLRFCTVVGLCRCRSACASLIVVYEGVICTEFALAAGRAKPRFNRVRDKLKKVPPFGRGLMPASEHGAASVGFVAP